MNLEVDQLLHGYSGGHRLLESSRKLSQDAQRTLLLLSDLSGPSLVPGFESYLTGYWIESDGLFAFARTWYAPEMERPGCVWTHTLLLQPALFYVMPRPGDLAIFFRRPSSGDFGEYAKPLQVTHESLNSDLQRTPYTLQPSLRRILQSLYGEPDRPLICPTISAETADALVMWVWNRQPNELQTRFTFSSGSLANRNRDTFRFDLQFMPANSAHVRHRASAGSDLVIDEDTPPVLSAELEAGIEELVDSPEHVTEFLRVIDSDLPGSRRALAIALELHSRVAHRQPVSLIETSNLSFVTEAFPDGLDATALKRWLVSTLLANSSSAIDLAELAKSLVTVPRVSESFSSTNDELTSIVGRIVRTDLSAAVHLANDVLTTASGSAGRFFQAFADCIDQCNIGAIANTSPPVLVACLRTKPSLLRLSGLWCAEPSIFDVVTGVLNDATVVPDSLLSDLVDPFLGGCGPNASTASGQPLGRLVGPVLTKLESRRLEDSALELIEVLLSEHEREAVEWCNSNDFSYSTFEVIANSAFPNDEWKRVPSGRWCFVTTTDSSTKWTSTRGLIAAAFLFAIVLDAVPQTEGVYEVVPSIFEPIHDAAGNGSLPYKAWEMLKPRVPPSSWFRNWDICDQLRRALVDKWLATEWPVRPLMAATRNPSTFKRIVEYCADAYHRRSLLRRMTAEIGERPESATEDQRWILQRTPVA